jgi:hypothetical protein
LAKTISKLANKNNGFTYMLSVKSNIHWKPQEVFPLCKTSFYQCILPKWTDTYTLVCTAQDKDIALSHQFFTAPITIAIQTKRAIQLTSLLIGPKTTTKTDTKKISLNPSLLPNVI